MLLVASCTHIAPRVAKFPSAVLKNLPKLCNMYIGFCNFAEADLVHVAPTLRDFDWVTDALTPAQWRSPSLRLLIPPLAIEKLPGGLKKLKQEVNLRLREKYH